MILAIVNEEIFKETIEKAAQGKSKDSLILAEEETLWAALQEGTPDVIFLEVGISTLDGPELIQKLKRNPSTQKIPLVVFGNSLRADLLQDAKELGADLVLPKAAFREQLSELLRHYDQGHS